MDWIPVSSTRMSQVAWQDNKLYVRFHDGAVYEYSNFTKSDFDSFLNSPSLGSELSRIDKIHPYRRV